VDPFHADSPRITNIVVYRILDVHGEEVPHLSRKVVNNLLPIATSYLCKTGFSAVAANKTKYHSMSDHF
jgi:hypothetical protein